MNVGETMNEAARNRMIDCLRGGSALAVALFHFNEPFPSLSDGYHRVVKWGWLGVSVFFVVSGFCIAAARQKDDAISFWWRRLLRIFPSYWASVCVVLGAVALRVVTSGTNDVTVLPKDFVGWFYTLAALTKPASNIASVNWAYWSLGYELAFYLVLGALVLRRSGWALIPFSLLTFFVRSYPFDQWGLFGLGVACYYFTSKQYWVAAILGAICLAQNFMQLSWPVAVTGGLVGLLILFPPAVMHHSFFQPLRQVGLFSYSLYLIHVPIGCYLLLHYLPFKLDRGLGPSLLQDLLLLTGCVFAAYLFYRFAEKPTHDLARRIRRRPTEELAMPSQAETVSVLDGKDP